MDLDPPMSQDPVVLLIDVSGSMDELSGSQLGAPKRIELAVHMAKVILAFCRKLRVKCVVYTFSSGAKQIPVDETTSLADCNRELHAVRPSGGTYLSHALNEIFATHGSLAKYFPLTDGEPTDWDPSCLEKFANTQFHLIAFGKAVNVNLLREVGGNPKHTISYIEDIRSLPGYMVPVFVWAMTDMKPVVLNDIDEECRKRFVEVLEPQVHGSTTRYRLEDLITRLRSFHGRSGTTYSRDLEIDTAGTSGHSRIEHSFDANNWHNFGKFYLLCILHCHKYLIPGNTFDPSLKHYRTPEYAEIFDKILDVPSNVEFVSFMTVGSQQAAVSAAASAVVQRAIQYVDTYTPSYSSSDDGCIGPDEKITVRWGNYFTTIPMKEIMPDTNLGRSRIKWIIRIRDLNHGNEIPLYNGLTPSHPVRGPDGRWIKAKHYPGAKMTQSTDIVYDVILDDPTVGSMKVNGIDVAVVGHPVPGMVHPYWGSQKVVEDVRSRYPDGGFVDVDAKQFQFTNGLVSSLFPVDE
jgi:uncharacterized protein YegL